MSPRALIVLGFLLAGATSLAPLPASTAGRAEELPELLPGAPLDATLAGGDTRAYRLRPPEDHPLRLTVEQRGVDAVIEVFGTDGRSLGVADSPLDRRGLEVFLLRLRPEARRSALQPRAPPGQEALPDSPGEATPRTGFRCLASRRVAATWTTPTSTSTWSWTAT